MKKVIVQRRFHASAWCAPLTTEGETVSPSVPISVKIKYGLWLERPSPCPLPPGERVFGTPLH